MDAEAEFIASRVTLIDSSIIEMSVTFEPAFLISSRAEPDCE